MKQNKILSTAILLLVTVTTGCAATAQRGRISIPQEKTLLSVCWVENVAAFFENSNQSCDNGTYTKVMWNTDSLPLRVTPVNSEGDALLEDSPGYREVEQAVKAFNRRVRFELYSISNRHTDVEVVWDSRFNPAEARIGGDVVFHSREGRVVFATVNITDTLSSRFTHRLLLHELGHIAGLAHDDFTDSLMYPIFIDDTMGTMRFDRLTDADTAVLNSLYN